MSHSHRRSFHSFSFAIRRETKYLCGEGNMDRCLLSAVVQVFQAGSDPPELE
jgi:hypothetical protein